MTGIDITVLSVVGISTLVSLLRGLIKELLSLVGLIASTVLTLALYDDTVKYIRTQTDSELLASAGAGIGLFVGFTILFGIINLIIVRVVNATGFTMLDRSLGMLFGLLRGAFLVSLMFLVFSRLLDEEQYPETLKKAQTLGALKFGASVMENFLPEEYKKKIDAASEDAREKIEQQKKNAEKEIQKQGDAAADESRQIIEDMKKYGEQKGKQ